MIMNAETATMLADGLEAATDGASVADLAAERDAMILALQKALRGLETP